MEAKLALIKANRLSGLSEQLKDCSADEHMQVLRYSSRCAYDSNTVHPDLLAIVTQACDGLSSAPSFNILAFYKNLYYIVQVAIKKEDYTSAVRLLSYLSSHISKCHNNAETSTFIKSLYQLAWNLSLRSPDAIIALKLQRHALIFFLTVSSLSKVVPLVTLAAANFISKYKKQLNRNVEEPSQERETSSPNTKDNCDQQLLSFYQHILLAVLSHVSLSKTLTPSDINEIITLLSSCKIHEHPSILKHSLKTLKPLCGQVCYSAVYTGLQTLLSALKVRHSGAPATEMEAAVGVVRQYHETVIVDAGARQVALQCLLASLHALERVDGQDPAYVPVSLSGLDEILSLVFTYITPDSESAVKIKVGESLQRWCRTLVSQLSEKAASVGSDRRDVMRKAAAWSLKAESNFPTLLPITAETAYRYHNLGVTCGNLGVFCFLEEDYKSSAVCLVACLTLQDLYCCAMPQQLICLSSSLHKRRSLLCDAERYCGNFSAAASVLARQVLHYAAESALQGSPTPEVPYDSIFATWFKLKKEALKSDSSVLQGTVLWMLVQAEVVRQPRLRPSGDLQEQLLQREFTAAAAASPSFSAEQLQCAQLLHASALAQLRSATGAAAAASALQRVVRAIVMGAQVAYFKPDVCIPKAFSPDALKSETLRACSRDGQKPIAESKCCSWTPEEACPALYLLSIALSICETVGSVSPFDTNELLSCTQLQNGKSSSKASKNSTRPAQNTKASPNKPGRRSGEASVPADWLETCAELHYWLMVALLQLLKLKKKPEPGLSTDSGVPSSLTAAAADLGDEQQPDDVCDVRGNSATLLHNPLLLHAASHLCTALHCWWLMMVGGTVPSAPEAVCKAIANVGQFCVLHGRTVDAVLSCKLLLHFATAADFRSYKLRACCELIWSCPELVDGAVVQEIEAELSSSGYHDSNTVVLAQVALAYHHFCKGQYCDGWPVLESVLRHEVVATKKTIRATEVQCLAHYTASLYSLLPPHVHGDSPAFNPVAVAQIAAREAIAVMQTILDVPDIYWPWRVSWLHQLTGYWFGRLALLSAQPRLARTYLKAPLASAHEDVLPGRAAMTIALLAEVDLLCDQMEDCRVKLDTLLTLFSSRPSRSIQALDFSPTFDSAVLTPTNLNKPVSNDATPLTTGSRVHKTLRRLGVRSGKENTHVEAMAASEPPVRIEAMRQAQCSSGENSPVDAECKDKFAIVDAQDKLGTQWVAIKTRLKYLGMPGTKIERYKLHGDRKMCPDSPSLGHRETALYLPSWRSPYADMDDAEAAQPDTQESRALDAYFPMLCDVYLGTGALLASYHRQGARWQATQDAIDTVQAAHAQMQKDIFRQCEIIASILGTNCDAERNTVVVTNALIVGWCNAQRSAVQVLVAREKWSEAMQLCNSAVSACDALPLQSVWRHHCHLLPLLLQARLLLNSHRHMTRSSRVETKTAAEPLASPVSCPTVAAVTPQHSPTRSQNPPPLHRAPQYYPQHQNGEESCDSDEENASGGNEDVLKLGEERSSSVPGAKTSLVNEKQHQALVEVSNSDEDNAATSECNKRSDAKSRRGSSTARTRLSTKKNTKVVPPKIVIIPESPENNLNQEDGDCDLFDLQNKLGNMVLNEHKNNEIAVKKPTTSSARSDKSNSRSREANTSNFSTDTVTSRGRTCTKPKKASASNDTSPSKPKRSARKITTDVDDGKENDVGSRTRRKRTCGSSREREVPDTEVSKERAPVTTSVRRGRSRTLRPGS